MSNTTEESVSYNFSSNSMVYSFDVLQNYIIQQLKKEATIIGSKEPSTLYKPIEYALSVGGKHLRPVFVLMACNMFKGNIKESLPSAIAIEIFHNFTLVHDDMMDLADIRRNKPTVVKKFGDNIALLSGDSISILSYEYLLKQKMNNSSGILELFTKSALRVCEGQQYDLDYEEKEVSLQQYLEMIRLKTAELIACSLSLGARLADAPKEDVNHMYNFGINFGQAFQLQDDLMDVYADQNIFGKKTGKDIVSNKKTFLLIKAMELANPEQKKELSYWIKTKNFEENEKIKAVKQIYKDLNIKEITREAIKKYYHKAIIEMDAIKVNPDRKKELISLTGKMIERKK